jgi:Fe-Mn family superoxide dismutase
MKKFEDKIKILNESLILQEQKENEKLFLFEMKKIGIEKLPYSYSALKQFIDAETMTYHYNKHYKGYVDKLNKALSKKKGGDLELESIIKSISKFDKTVRNNAGGAFNHALFWKMLSPKTQKPSGEVLSKINKDFGSYKNFQTKFEETSKDRFGSGWAWLVLTKNNKLKITSTPNQDNPLMNVIKDGGYPILGLDLWEHAYYLKYRNKRDEYIKNFWKAVNWEFVNKLLESKTKNNLNESYDMRQIIKEGVSEKCSREMNDTIRFIFNINPKVKTIYRYGIDSILKEVFPDNFYGQGQYKEGEMSGIYDLEGEGRSVINKLNTNYTCFCILLTDVNKVLKASNKPEINIVGQPPFVQISETKKFVKFLDDYKSRVFNPNSGTFKNLMSTLGLTHDLGGKREDYTIKVLKNKFGDENVEQIGDLGNKEDMIGGVDGKVSVDGKVKTLQIKPFSNIKTAGDLITVFNSGQVKKYSTDWIVFANSKKGVLIFDNKHSKIVGGNYTFPINDLIYELS